MPSLEKCLFRSSARFFYLDFSFLVPSCICCSYILDTNPLSVTLLADIFSHSVDCLFMLLFLLLYNLIFFFFCAFGFIVKTNVKEIVPNALFSEFYGIRSYG